MHFCGRHPDLDHILSCDKSWWVMLHIFWRQSCHILSHLVLLDQFVSDIGNFSERQSHHIVSFDQQLVSDISHFLWKAISPHLVLWPTEGEWHCILFCKADPSYLTGMSQPGCEALLSALSTHYDISVSTACEKLCLLFYVYFWSCKDCKIAFHVNQAYHSLRLLVMQVSIDTARHISGYSTYTNLTVTVCKFNTVASACFSLNNHDQPSILSLAGVESSKFSVSVNSSFWPGHNKY